MYIALDIGGTNIRIAGKNDLNSQNFDKVTKVKIQNNYQSDFEVITSAIKEMAGDLKIKAIGAGVPATFTKDKKGLVVAANLSDWSNRSFVSDLESIFNCEVKMENDDTVSALGEAVYGKGINKEFVYITWGTGLGAAYVSRENGKISVYQFEAGHQFLDWSSDRQCGCGQYGCAEVFVGGGNIAKYYNKDASQLTEFEWNEIIEKLGHTLSNIMTFRPVSLIILGGGIAISQRNRIEKVRDVMTQRLRIATVPILEITDQGDDLGLNGAFALLTQ